MLLNPYSNSIMVNPFIQNTLHPTSKDPKAPSFIPNLNFMKTSLQFLSNIQGNPNNQHPEQPGIKKLKTEQPLLVNIPLHNQAFLNENMLGNYSSQNKYSSSETTPSLISVNNGINSIRNEMNRIEQLNQNRIAEYFARIQNNDKIINELSRLISLKNVRTKPEETVKIEEKEKISQDEISTDKSPSAKSNSSLEKPIQNHTGIKRKNSALEQNNIVENPDIKIQKPLKLKRFSKKRSYVQKRRELKEIAELESQLDLLMKKNKKECDSTEEILKDAKRRPNGLQKIKKINEKIEKIQETDVREEVVCNFMRVENSREILIGAEYQANIPNLTKEKRNNRQTRMAWSPEWVKTEELDNYINELVEVLGCKEICEDKTLKLLMRSKMDKETALVSVKKNKTYYKNMLCPASRKYINELKKLS